MYMFFKRLFDIVVSFIAILILLPFMLPVVLLLLLTGEHHVFYLQERVGYRNKLFSIYKFATMLQNSPNMEGGLITLKRDPRLTPLGGFLRSSKINELPQLLNILFGDMSFVGPRPVMQKSFDAYPDEVKACIYNVPPGLTGIGSIVFRDEESLITEVKQKGGDTWAYYTEVIYPYKGKLELWYQQNNNFMVDMQIILLTAWGVLKPHSTLYLKIFKGLPEFKQDAD